MIEACGQIYIIGQITARVSLPTLAAWVELTYGIEYSPNTLMLAIKRHGVQRKQRDRSIPDAVLMECAQLALIQIAHGIRQPWMRVSDQLWTRHQIRESSMSLGNKVRSWMRAQ
jgi:hypothetical protein